jgi:hypothetical protein
MDSFMADDIRVNELKGRGQEGIPQGLKPLSILRAERPKAEALGYLEATTAGYLGATTRGA